MTTCRRRSNGFERFLWMLPTAIALASCSNAAAVPAAGSFGRDVARAPVVASIRIEVPASPVPLGQFFSFRVLARDPSGATIHGAYDHPIVLEAGGLALSRYSIANATQGAALIARWAEGVGGPAAATLEARANGHQAVAYVTPGTGFAYYGVGDDPAADFSGFQMVLGPDGDLYYGTIGHRACPPPCPPLSGAIGRFDPTTSTFAEIDLPSEILGLLFTGDGALWAAGGTSGNVFRLPPHTFAVGAVQTIAVPPPTSHAPFTPRLLAEDGSANVWFGDGAGGRLLRIAEAGPYTTAGIAAFAQPKGPKGTPQAAPFIGGIAYDGLGHIDALDYNNGVIDVVNTSNGRSAGETLLPQQRTLGVHASAAPRFLVAGTSRAMWLSYLGAARSGLLPAGGIDRFNPQSGRIAAVPLANVPAGELPDSLSLNAANLYYADIGTHAVGVVNVATKSSRLIPTQPFVNFNARLSPGGIAALGDGTAWFICANGVKPFKQLCLGHTVYLNGWSIFPGPTFNVGRSAALSQIVGIMEAPDADSGPFVAATAQARICRLGKVTDHNFVVAGLTKGVCTVNVTDAHAVTETVKVTVF